MVSQCSATAVQGSALAHSGVPPHFTPHAHSAVPPHCSAPAVPYPHSTVSTQSSAFRVLPSSVPPQFGAAIVQCRQSAVPTQCIDSAVLAVSPQRPHSTFTAPSRTFKAPPHCPARPPQRRNRAHTTAPQCPTVPHSPVHSPQRCLSHCSPTA